MIELPRDPAEYQFVIPGACPPKGSRVPVRKGSDKTRESSKRVEPWTTEAIRSMRDRLGKPRASFSGPVYVAPVFYFRQPEVTDSEFPVAPTIGDVDKLVRCLLDALTKAGVIEDDRFVVDLIRPRKRWSTASYTVAQVGSVRPPNLVDISTFGEEPGTTLIEGVRPVAQNPYAVTQKTETAANEHHECLLVLMPCTDLGCPVYVPPMI